MTRDGEMLPNAAMDHYGVMDGGYCTWRGSVGTVIRFPPPYPTLAIFATHTIFTIAGFTLIS